MPTKNKSTNSKQLPDKLNLKKQLENLRIEERRIMGLLESPDLDDPRKVKLIQILDGCKFYVKRSSGNTIYATNYYYKSKSVFISICNGSVNVSESIWRQLQTGDRTSDTNISALVTVFLECSFN